MVCEAIKHQRSPTPTHSSQHVLPQREVGFLHLVNEDTATVRGCYIQMKYMTKPDHLTSPTINKNNGKVNTNARVIISTSDHWLLASSSFCCKSLCGCTRTLTFFISVLGEAIFHLAGGRRLNTPTMTRDSSAAQNLDSV